MFLPGYITPLNPSRFILDLVCLPVQNSEYLTAPNGNVMDKGQMKLRKSRFGIHDSEVTLHLRGAGGGLVRNVMKEEALEHFKTKTFTSKEQVPEDFKKFIESISSANSLQVLKANAHGYHQRLQKLQGILETKGGHRDGSNEKWMEDEETPIFIHWQKTHGFTMLYWQSKNNALK